MLDLEQEGYLVHRTVRTPIIGPGGRVVGSHANDVFGVFDLLAVSPRHLRCVQVTTTGEIRRRMRKVETVLKHFPRALAISIEVWGWVGGGKRRDKRTGAWVRRQYFRTYAWIGGEWLEQTPADAGRIDDRKGAP